MGSDHYEPVLPMLLTGQPVISQSSSQSINQSIVQLTEAMSSFTMNPYSNFSDFYQLNGPPSDPRFAQGDLKEVLREVVNSPRFSLLCNEYKSYVLLDLENDGEYDPNNY